MTALTISMDHTNTNYCAVCAMVYGCLFAMRGVPPRCPLCGCSRVWEPWPCISAYYGGPEKEAAS